MKKQLTTNQACVLLAVCLLSTKIQRLPALLVEDFGRDSWIMFFIMLMFDFLVAILFIHFLVKLEDKTFFELIKERLGVSGKIVFSILLMVFFLAKAIITYKGIHEFFANVLFDKLPWKYFSILFILVLLIMVFGGLNSLGRSAELYAFMIGFGMFTTLLLGVGEVKLINLLPVLDCDFSGYLKDVLRYQPWMGDFMVLPLFFGNVKITKSPKLRLSTAYITAGLVSVVEIVFFYGINQYLSVYQSNALSAITHYSLIGLGIGRPDWFLVLFVLISKIISTGLYVFGYTKCISEIIGVQKNYITQIISVASLYFIEYYLFKNLENSANYYRNVICYIMFGINCIIIVLLMILMLKELKKEKTPQIVNFYRARCEI